MTAVAARGDAWVVRTSVEDPHCWDGLYGPEVATTHAAYHGERVFRPRHALLLVDLYQDVFVTEGGGTAMPAEPAQAALGVASRLLGAARAAGLPAVFTTNESRAEARLERITQRERARPVDLAEAYRIHPAVAPRAGEPVVYKTRASGFFRSPLDVLLRERGISTLVVCGGSTSGCVRATAVDAFAHGFDVLVVEDGVFDHTRVSHCANLFDLHHKYATVAPSGAVTELLASR